MKTICWTLMTRSVFALLFFGFTVATNAQTQLPIEDPFEMLYEQKEIGRASWRERV